MMAECKHKSCGIFKFVISDKRQYDKDVRVNVLVLSPVVLHQRGEIKRRVLRGKKRKEAQEQMKTQTPASLLNTQFGEMPEEEIVAGNYTKCRSEAVYRKAKNVTG